MEICLRSVSEKWNDWKEESVGSWRVDRLEKSTVGV